MVDELTFDRRVAIVTGGGGGLGRAHALLLAERGARVVVNDIGGAVDGSDRSEGPANDVVSQIRAGGGMAVADTNGVETPEGGVAIVDTALEAFGRVDIVVNNAGILRDRTFHNLSSDDLEAVLDVHLRGTIHVTQPAWARMRDQGYGRVVTTASPAGLYGNFGQSNYSAAKMGLVGLTRTLAVEGAKHGIHANVISPMALTRMTADLLPGELAAKLAPERVSPLVAWLAHESCDVSGQIFTVGGGRVARVIVAETSGYIAENLTPEDIAAHRDEITGTEVDFVPTDAGEQGAQLLPRLP